MKPNLNPWHLIALAVPLSALAQEIPYDYYHASSCFSNFGSMYAAGGYITPDTVGLFVTVTCPIPRIYPRHPGRLLRVAVDMALPDATYGSFVRGVKVCTKLSQDESAPACSEPKTTSGTGMRRIEFNTEELSPVRGVPFGWDQYMYIEVDLLGPDHLYGYQTNFNLE